MSIQVSLNARPAINPIIMDGVGLNQDYVWVTFHGPGLITLN